MKSWTVSPRITFILLALAFTLSCDEQWDVPPVPSTEDLTPNITIRELKQRAVKGQSVQIDEDWIIGGQVVSNDRFGNFYKVLVIQDSTGGLPISINATDFYVLFEPGRTVYVKCRGLTLTDRNNDIYLDLYGQRIPDNLYREYVYRGTEVEPVTPRLRTIYALSEADLGTLIKLEDVEFSVADKPLRYAEEDRPANRTIEDCIGNVLVVRTSNYADFALAPIPDGNGWIVGVLSRYRNTLQLTLRDTSDVSMRDSSCLLSSGGTLIDIASVRAMFQGSTVPAPAGKKIRGVVISDRAHANLHERNLVLQDQTAGILVRFRQPHSFDLYQEIELLLDGSEISEYNGMLQINNATSTNAQIVGSSMVQPQDVTVADLLSDFESYEAELVRLHMVQFSGATVFREGPEVRDGTGSILLFTRNQASFADQPVPASANTLVAIVSQGGRDRVKQLLLRNLDDIDGSSGGGGPDTLDVLDEDFSSFPDGQDIDSRGWKSFAIEGNRQWRIKTYRGNAYAQATAFRDNAPSMVTMLVTPPLRLDKPKILQFESAKAFWTHQGLSVWISTDFDGQNIAQATWHPLQCRLASESDPDHEWIASGDIDLSAYAGIAYIAFRYEGSGPNGKTTSARIDNVKVQPK